MFSKYGSRVTRVYYVIIGKTPANSQYSEGTCNVFFISILIQAVNGKSGCQYWRQPEKIEKTEEKPKSANQAILQRYQLKRSQMKQHYLLVGHAGAQDEYVCKFWISFFSPFVPLSCWIVTFAETIEAIINIQQNLQTHLRSLRTSLVIAQSFPVLICCYYLHDENILKLNSNTTVRSKNVH